MKDRTVEFQSAIENYVHRSDIGFQDGPLIKSNNPVRPFMKMAAQIGQEINSVSTKLAKLASLAKNKSSFDDPSVEIQELTFIVKQDIGKLNNQIAALQKYQKDNAPVSNNKQTEEHSSNVVVSLQSKLANTSANFKDILEVRTMNMKSQKERRQHFTSGTSTIPQQISIDMGTSSYASMELIQPSQSQSYLDARSQAIQNVEQTIAELGTIFQQLATMVAQQGETIQRIDDNVDAMSSNIERGEIELLRYWKNISSDRWMMAKVFSIVLLFFILFVVFLS